jgi:uncharacterized membrane protein (DUF373 family)
MTTQAAPERPGRPPGGDVSARPGWSLLGGLVGFELLLYIAVGVLLAVASIFVLVGTVHELVHAISARLGGVDTGVIVLDRVLLLLIIAELVYTLRFVLRTHEIVVEPFLYIGLIAVVRRILIVTAQFERPAYGGRALTNLLLELGLLGFLALAVAASLFLIRRGRPGTAA